MRPHLASAFGLIDSPALEELAVQVADLLPPPLGRRELEYLLAQLDMSDRDITRAIRALVEPESACPGCVRDAGAVWPAGATSRSCARHIREFARDQPQRQPKVRKGGAHGDIGRSRRSALRANQAVVCSWVTAPEHAACRPPAAPILKSRQRPSSSAPARRLIHTAKQIPNITDPVITG